jgi:hypothetical protein
MKLTHIDKFVSVRWYNFQKRWMNFGEISCEGSSLKLFGANVVLVCTTATLHQAQIQRHRFPVKIKRKLYNRPYKEFFHDIIRVLYTKFHDFYLKCLSIWIIFNRNCFIRVYNVVSLTTINLDLQWINIRTCKIAKNSWANYVIHWSPSAVCTLSYRTYLVLFIKFCFMANMNVNMHFPSLFGKKGLRDESGKNLSSICLIGLYWCYLLFRN